MQHVYFTLSLKYLDMEILINEFNAITKMKIFEIEVFNYESMDKDFIIFNIAIDGDYLIAQHEPLTHKEAASKFIAFKRIELDECFSIDELLQELYSECLMAILNSDFFQLSEEI